MYIAIEGIKGSGKSTIIDLLVNDYNKKGISPEIFPITAPMELTHPLEKTLSIQPSKAQSDSFLEKLFLCRAYWQQHKISEKSQIIIGDRSIATACATRWHKWGNPSYTCRRVKWQYAGILRPQIIIWLDTPLEFAVKNISKRPQKITGKNDESIERLIESQMAYTQLLFGKEYEKTFGKVEVVNVKNDINIDVVVENIKSIINKYQN